MNKTTYSIEIACGQLISEGFATVADLPEVTQSWIFEKVEEIESSQTSSNALGSIESETHMMTVARTTDSRSNVVYEVY